MTMLKSYQPPSVYWVKKMTCQCNDCGAEFSLYLPSGNEIMKFVEEGGDDEKWLPVYGEGGYLELLEKLISGFSKEDSVSMKIAIEFEREFKRLQLPSTTGNKYSSLYENLCTKCSSKNLLMLAEEVLESPDIDWIKYKVP